MLKLSMQVAFAAVVVCGSTTIAAAQGYDPNGANRFQRLVQAGTAGYYLGELQGPMAEAIMRDMASSQVSLNTGYQIDPYMGSNQPPAAPMYARRTAYAPAPGYVTPQY